MNLLDNNRGRNTIAFAFYFAEGVPIGFIWWAMPTFMRQHGADLGMIGTFTALLTLPWVLKFLWAPLVDVFRTEKFGFVRWIGMSQILMCLSLVPLLFIPLKDNLALWGFCLFMHSMFAATQDVSVDALVINFVAKKQKGLLNGYMQAGMLLGRSLFGGGALIIAGKFGLQITIAFMIAAILIVILLLPFIKEPASIKTVNTGLAEFKFNLSAAFKNKNTWYGFAFALTAAAAFEAAGAFAGPLFTDLDISAESIGFFFAIPVVISMLTGGLVGGFLSDRMSRKKAVGVFTVGFVLMVAGIALFGYSDFYLHYTFWMALFCGMYFFTGMFTASSYALFMDITDPKIGATQFSSFMAATNACEAWVVYSAGLVAFGYGYNPAFLAMCGVSIISLFFLKKIKVG